MLHLCQYTAPWSGVLPQRHQFYGHLGLYKFWSRLVVLVGLAKLLSRLGLFELQSTRIFSSEISRRTNKKIFRGYSEVRRVGIRDCVVVSDGVRAMS